MLLLGAALRLAYLRAYPFDGLYGQDAYAYHDFAVGLRTGEVGNFYFPLGYPLLLTPIYALFGDSSGQALSLILGSALAPLVYALAREIGCKAWGAFTAGLIMAVCGQAVQSSLVIMSDVPALFWSLLSALALLRYLTMKSPGWLALSAGLLAFAGITRWLAFGLVIPWGLAVLLSGRIRWRHVIAAGAAALLVTLPQIVYSAQFRQIRQYPVYVAHWSPVHFFERNFVTEEGQFHYDQINAVYYLQPLYAPYYLSPLIAPLALIGAWALIRKQHARAALLIGWLIVPLVALMGMPFQNIRFPLTVVPALAALVGTGVERLPDGLIQWIASLRGTERQIIRRTQLLSLTFAILVTGGSLHTLIASRGTITGFLERQRSDHAVIEWARDRLPPGSTVYTFGLTLALRHDTNFEVYELYYETPETLVSKTHPPTVYLLLNLWNIQNQWQGREPDIAFRWFRAHGTATRLGGRNGYSLIRVEFPP